MNGKIKEFKGNKYIRTDLSSIKFESSMPFKSDSL